MIMITRLSSDNASPYGSAVRQMIFVVLGIVFGLTVPVLIRKLKVLENWTYIYAGVGGAALLIVAVFAVSSGGAKLSFDLGPISIQPSEFVKILFVFFVASSLKKSVEFKNIVVTTSGCGGTCTDPCAVHGSGCGADLLCGVSDHALCGHETAAVRTGGNRGRGARGCYRVPSVLPHPGESTGVAGSVCRLQRRRISAGAVPLCDRDRELVRDRTVPGTAGHDTGCGDGFYIFCDHRTRYLRVYALCLILICVSCYVMFLNIAMELRDPFYKLIALGLGTCYIFQVFLQIGGVTKFSLPPE